MGADIIVLWERVNTILAILMFLLITRLFLYKYPTIQRF
jgi:hypothetical protein